MKVVVQRVQNASVTVNQKVVSSIGHGLLLFVGIHTSDNEQIASYLAKKVAKLRIFNDKEGKMNLNLHQVGGEVLSVSQFTLYGDTSDGNRPSFKDAMSPEKANQLYHYFNEVLGQQLNQKIHTGIFQTDMAVFLVNDGPVTILLEKS